MASNMRSRLYALALRHSDRSTRFRDQMYAAVAVASSEAGLAVFSAARRWFALSAICALLAAIFAAIAWYCRAVSMRD